MNCCQGTPCNKHHPPCEVTVNTMLPHRRGERAHGHIQPWYPGKYSGPNSALLGCKHAGTPSPQSRPRQGRQDKGTVSVPLRTPQAKLEVQPCGQGTPLGAVMCPYCRARCWAAKWWHFQSSSPLREHKWFWRVPDDSFDRYLHARAGSARFYRSGSTQR